MLAWRGAGRRLAAEPGAAAGRRRARVAVGFRADVDGLRAVAVVPVLLFHAGFPAFGGGFVGVDVFFVISGYLITSIILSDLETGRFSILAFYDRRIRRIFPALFAMIAATVAVGLAVLLPDDLGGLGRSVVAATLFATNVLFWREAGYFEAPAEQEPLLHTWSLAVEEQFYVAFPLLMYLLFRFGRGRHAAVLIPGLALSLALAEWGVRHEPAATFYLAPTRAWELLLGALLAVGAVPAPGRQAARDGLSLLGLGLIAWAVFAFSPRTPFPGLSALVPCLGAALVIHAGAGGRSPGGRLLGSEPLVFVGLISYSLYLWHWPMLVLARYVAVRELTGTETLGVLLLSAVVAILSWRFVERPFRGRRLLASRGSLFATAGAATAAVLGLGLALALTEGLPARVPAAAAGLAAAAESHGDKACLLTTHGPVREDALCRIGAAAGSARSSVVLWGDSHAWALMDAVGRVAAEAGRAGLVAAQSLCPPLLGVDVGLSTAPETCRAANDTVLDLVTRNAAIDTVVLAARWPMYSTGVAYGREGDRPAVLVEGGGAGPRSAEANGEVLRRGLARTVAALAAAGKRVVVVGPVPEVGAEVPSALARSAWFGRSVAAVAPSRVDFDERNRVVLAALDGIGRETPATVVRPHEALCDAAKCRVERDGQVLYFDDNHLSLDGQVVVRPIFEGVFPGRGR